MIRYILSMVRIIWLLAIAVAIVTLIWTTYLSTFGSIDLGIRGIVLLLFTWIPKLAFIIISLLFVRGKDILSGINLSMFAILFLSILSLTVSVILLREPILVRQQQEIRTRDREAAAGGVFREEPRRITSDGRFRYQLSIVGIYTESPRVRFNIFDAYRGTRWSIPVDFDIEGADFSQLLPDAILIMLEPTDE